MIFKIKLIGLTFINFAFPFLCYAKITDKQYASMPDLFHQDNYDKCMLLEDEALYCSFTYELQPLHPTNVSNIWKIIKEVSSDRYHYRHDHMRHSICIPFTCPDVGKAENEEDLRRGITQCYNAKLKKYDLEGKIANLYCQTAQPIFHVDWVDITAAIFFACYVALVMFASIYEGAFRSRSQEAYKSMLTTRWGKFWTALSIPNNWGKLKTIGTGERFESLRSLQGIRFYNMLLVIWSHTALFMEHTKVLNTKYTENSAQRFHKMFLSAGAIGLTPNFFLSTFLLTENILLHFEGKKEIRLKTIILHIFYRYLRLTPTMAVLVLFYATWLRHLGSGPEWNWIVGSEFEKCRQTGWMNLLYFNVILFNYEMCLGQTWYLSYDTMYFIIFVPIIFYITKHPKTVWPILASMLMINMLGAFIQNYRGNYEALLYIAPETTYDFRMVQSHQMGYQANSFIGNIAGSIFGVGYGYLYHKYRNRKMIISNAFFYDVLIEIVTRALSLIFFIPAMYFIFYREPHDPFLASLYVAFSRPVFMLGIGGLIFAATKEMGLSRYILNWPPYYILGKLSYCVYLTHLALMFIRAGTLRPPIYISDFTVLHTFLGDIFISYIAALFLTLFIEMPTNELQKLILSPNKTQRTQSKDESKKE